MPHRQQQKRFIGKLLKLAGGTAAGQAVLLAATPVLTRLYSPEEFGLFGTFAAFVSFATVLAAWRLEQAVLSVKDDSEAARLTDLAIRLSIGNTFAATATLAALWHWDLLGFGILRSQDLGWAAMAICSGAVFFVLRAWLIRFNFFGLTARVTVWQNTGRAGGQMTLGAMGLGATGLVAGETFGRLMGIGRMARTSLERLRQHRADKPESFGSLLQRHSNYWRYGLLSTGLNSAAAYLPVPLVGYYYGVEAAGWYALAHRLVATPFALVSRSAADAFHHEFTEHWHDSAETAHQIVRHSAINLARFAVPTGLLGSLTAPLVTGYLLGREWEIVGWMVAALVPWGIASSIVSPLSRVIFVLDKQMYKLVYDTVALASTLVVFHLCASQDFDVLNTIFSYAMVQTILYAFYFWLLSKAIGSKRND